jgi:hypothetical protein
MMNEMSAGISKEELRLLVIKIRGQDRYYLPQLTTKVTFALSRKP